MCGIAGIFACSKKNDVIANASGNIGYAIFCGFTFFAFGLILIESFLVIVICVSLLLLLLLLAFVCGFDILVFYSFY